MRRIQEHLGVLGSRPMRALALVGLAAVASACGSAERRPASADTTKQRGGGPTASTTTTTTAATARATTETTRRLAPQPVLPADPDAVVRLVDVGTDNYKASFNADPDTPERRTWLAIRDVELAGDVWELAPDEEAPAGQARFVDELDLAPADDPRGGRRLTARVHVVEGPVGLANLRVGPQPGRWGPLLEVEAAGAVRDHAVRLTLVLEAADETFMLPLEYRHDEDLAAAPESSLEHNGPGGRWYVVGERTETNLELGWE